ncbi:MAG TPA: penicillin acylase family protein [Thermoanaerobaculia bacterium]|nr:penicillin acylase family protein [Thermoanaerobaculia bacterium]
MKKLFSLVLLLALATAPALAATANSVENVQIQGMHFPGTITRDSLGKAHIDAWTRHDLYFLQGYVHAEDRLFQMDSTRRAGSGTLAELVGSAGLAGDVQARAIGLRRAAEASLAALSPDVRAAINAYAAGVNAGIARFPLPPEYAGLEISRVEPWSPVDTLTVGKAIAFNLSFDLSDIDRTVALLTYIGAGQQVGFNGQALFFEDLFRSEPFTSASTVPDASGPAFKGNGVLAGVTSDGVSRAVSKIHPNMLGMLQDYRRQMSQSPLFSTINVEEMSAGSNEWAIAGRHTTSGNALMANDPHLSLSTPSTFYPISLRSGRLNVTGVGFAGVPGVILGRNQFIGWGATVNPMDVTDIYQEQVVIDPTAPAQLSTIWNGQREWLFPILQTFRRNVIGDGINDNLAVVPAGGAIPQAVLVVPRKNAAIISLDAAAGVAVSVQFTGLWATRELEAFIRFNEATNLDEFREGLQYFDFGSQNFSYFDVEGNIAYFTSAEMPIREDLQNQTVEGLPPYFLRDGSGGNDWVRLANPPAGQAIPFEILPANEMPHVINPPAGWFVNSNNDPAGTTLDNDPLNQLRPGGGIFYLSPGYDGFRGGRITEMIRQKLAAGGKFSLADMKQMQADTVMIDAQFFVPHIVNAYTRSQGSANPLLAGLGASPAIAAAVGALQMWDFSTPTGIREGYDAADVNGQLSEPSAAEISRSVAATVYSVWRGQVLKNTVDGVLAAGGLPRPDGATALTALKKLIDRFPQRQGVGISGVNFFNVTGVSSAEDRRDIIFLKSLADALTLLSSDEFAPAFGNSTNPMDYRWGKLHRIVFRHALGGPLSIPPAGGAWPHPLPGLSGIPTDGGFGVVDASAHSPRAATLNGFMFGSGPSRRFVGEAGNGLMVSESILPGGVSGVPGPLYFNILPLWLTNEYYPHSLPGGPRLPWGRR